MGFPRHQSYKHFLLANNELLKIILFLRYTGIYRWTGVDSKNVEIIILLTFFSIGNRNRKSQKRYSNGNDINQCYTMIYEMVFNVVRLTFSAILFYFIFIFCIGNRWREMSKLFEVKCFLLTAKPFIL